MDYFDCHSLISNFSSGNQPEAETWLESISAKYRYFVDLKELKTGSGKALDSFAIAHSKSGLFTFK